MMQAAGLLALQPGLAIGLFLFQKSLKPGRLFCVTEYLGQTLVLGVKDLKRSVYFYGSFFEVRIKEYINLSFILKGTT